MKTVASIPYRWPFDGDYAPQTEGGVIWNDPDLAIDWPVGADAAVLSDKDRLLPRLADLPDPVF